MSHIELHTCTSSHSMGLSCPLPSYIQTSIHRHPCTDNNAHSVFACWGWVGGGGSLSYDITKYFIPRQTSLVQEKFLYSSCACQPMTQMASFSHSMSINQVSSEIDEIMTCNLDILLLLLLLLLLQWCNIPACLFGC